MKTTRAGQPLYLQIKDYLAALIEENANVPHFKLPSENQLALKFNTSRITAKNAINLLCQEGAIVRYQGKGSFINPMRRQAQTEAQAVPHVSILVPDLASEFIGEIVKSIHGYFFEQDILCELFCTYQNQALEEKAVRCALNNGSLGLVVYPVDSEIYNREIVKLSVSGVPTVLVDRKLPGLDLEFVSNDHYRSAYDLTKLFLDRGRREILFMSQVNDQLSSVSDREKGHRAALMDHGVAACHFFRLEAEDSFSDVERKLRTCFEENPQIDALITTTDLNAELASNALSSLGKTLGREGDVAAAVFNETVPAYFDPVRKHVVKLRQFPDRIGERAARCLHRQMRGNFERDNAPVPHEISLEAEAED